MFKPITEYEAGNLCSVCWGSGKTFGDIPTPKRITITGAGFTGACAPCNDTFIAEQDGVDACKWTFDNGTVIGSYVAGPVVSVFTLQIKGGPVCYLQNGAICALTSTFGVTSVTVAVNEPVTPEHKISYLQNFSPTVPSYALNLGSANSDEVLIVARRRDRVKMHFRFTPDY